MRKSDGIKKGLLVYDEGPKFFNIGDYIQSLAAMQFYNCVDTYVNREKLAKYDDDELLLILNGWFTHNVNDWVPSSKILPLFISFHLNSTAAREMLTEGAIEYLKAHSPIGCRDMYTQDLLKSKGIDAYFSGCLTLTLDSYRVPNSERTDNIYIVDPLYNYPTWERLTMTPRSAVSSLLKGKFFDLKKKKQHINNLIDTELQNSAIFIPHDLPARKYNDVQKFEIAKQLLMKYARAKLVITSRIHCALPCLALGTPVIYINGFNEFLDTSRFGGILELFNRIDIDFKTGEYTANFPLNSKICETTTVENPKTYLVLADNLKKTCIEFVRSASYE